MLGSREGWQMFPTAPVDVNRRLSEIQGELWDLDDDDFETRYALQLEQNRLRADARRGVDLDTDRTTKSSLTSMDAAPSPIWRHSSPVT